MFDIGWTEMLLVSAVTLIVVGPKEIPRVLKTCVTIMRKVRGMADDVRRGVDDVVRQVELDEIKDITRTIDDSLHDAVTSDYDFDNITPWHDDADNGIGNTYPNTQKKDGSQSTVKKSKAKKSEAKQPKSKTVKRATKKTQLPKTKKVKAKATGAKFQVEQVVSKRSSTVSPTSNKK